MVSIGKIIRSEGTKGELKLRLFGGHKLKSRSTSEIFIGKRGALEGFRVESLVPGKGDFILKLEGVNSLSQADGLAGYEVFVPEEFLEPLEEDQYYSFHLQGCTVLDKDRKRVGMVVDILAISQNNLLVVEEEGREILIPFNKSICLEVDLKKKEIIVDIPEGLLELNEI